MLEESRREDAVRSAREHLITQGLLRASPPASLVAEEIEQSWRRSVSLRVDPTAEPHVLGEIDPDSSILRAAGRVLDQWQTNLTDTRMALFLADEEGCIVSRRTVNSQDGRTMDQANAAEGFDFSEQALGTNGLGTPIEGRGVVFVRGSEHFNDALAQFACAGAPIKHPITGRIVGSLSLASHVDAASPLMVAMVRQAGLEIAEALERMADSRDLELARTYRGYRSSRHPVLVMNSGTVMTDLPALAHFDAESHADLWERLRRHRWDDEKLQLELPALGADATVRRFGRAGPDAIFALEFVKPPVSSASAEHAAVRAPQTAAAAPLRDTLNELTPHLAPVNPYENVQRQLNARATDEGLIRLVGAPGVGKRHQAVRWLRRRTEQDPILVVASEVDLDGTGWKSGEDALRGGRGIVVIGGDDLDNGMRQRLEDFAKLHRPRVHPGARVILTERGAEATGAERASAGSSTAIYVPALVELRENIPFIVRAVMEDRFPGVETPQFSPTALQCLVTWSWTGNVSELVGLLASFGPRLGKDLIQTKDLPESMRKAAPKLSRYEQAERDAISSALREADGNKSRAAEELGIGRTTLYRKMRSLKIDPY